MIPAVVGCYQGLTSTLPQHISASSLRSAQAWSVPRLKSVKGPLAEGAGSGAGSASSPASVTSIVSVKSPPFLNIGCRRLYGVFTCFQIIDHYARVVVDIRCDVVV